MEEIKYNQPSNKPIPKVVAVGQAGAVLTALFTLLAVTGVTVPEDVSEATQNTIVALSIAIPAIQTIVLFIAGYIKRDKKSVEAVAVIQNNVESLRG